MLMPLGYQLALVSIIAFFKGHIGMLGISVAFCLNFLQHIAFGIHNGNIRRIFGVGLPCLWAQHLCSHRFSLKGSIHVKRGGMVTFKDKAIKIGILTYTAFCCGDSCGEVNICFTYGHIHLRKIRAKLIDTCSACPLPDLPCKPAIHAHAFGIGSAQTLLFFLMHGHANRDLCGGMFRVTIAEAFWQSRPPAIPGLKHCLP